MNLGVHVSVGESSTVLGLIGDTAKVDLELVESLDIVRTTPILDERITASKKPTISPITTATRLIPMVNGIPLADSVIPCKR